MSSAPRRRRLRAQQRARARVQRMIVALAELPTYPGLVAFCTPRGPRSWAYDVWMRGSLA